MAWFITSLISWFSNQGARTWDDAVAKWDDKNAKWDDIGVNAWYDNAPASWYTKN